MMRTKVTAALSLAGVLMAGSAAALVNTQVLQSSADDGTVAAGPAATSGDSVADTTVPVVDDTAAAPASGTQAVYQIGAAGTVVLDSSGDVLTIVSAAPAAGWLVVGADHTDSTHVEVRLQSNTTIVTFRASLLFGVVSTSVESSDAGVTTSVLPTVSTPSGGSTQGSTPTTGGSSGSGSGGTVTTVDDHGGDDDGSDDDDDHEEEDD